MGKARRYLVVVAALFCAAFTAAPALAATPATTGEATNLTTTSALLHGVVNTSDSQSSWHFEYGPTATLGQRTPSHPIGSGQSNVSDTVSNLQPGTTYFYRLVVVQGQFPYSVTSTGQTRTFTTMPPPGAVATTGDATSVTRHSAILNGVVDSNSNSTYFFQYGRTRAYGKATPTMAVGAGLSAVSSKIKGLKPGTTYYFRLIVYQGGDPSQVERGGNHAFTSKPRPPRASLRSTRLNARHGILTIPLRCSGPRGSACTGTVIVRARHNGALCAKVHVRVPAGRRKDARTRVSTRCAALLNRARHHRISGRLTGRFKGQPRPLRASVTLVRQGR